MLHLYQKFVVSVALSNTLGLLTSDSNWQYNYFNGPQRSTVDNKKNVSLTSLEH